MLYLFNDLVSYVIHMCSTFRRTNTIDKRNLSKFSIRKRDNNLPTLIISALVSNLDTFLSIAEVHVYIFEKRVDFKLISI